VLLEEEGKKKRLTFIRVADSASRRFVAAGEGEAQSGTGGLRGEAKGGKLPVCSGRNLGGRRLSTRKGEMPLRKGRAEGRRSLQSKESALLRLSTRKKRGERSIPKRMTKPLRPPGSKGETSVGRKGEGRYPGGMVRKKALKLGAIGMKEERFVAGRRGTPSQRKQSRRNCLPEELDRLLRREGGGASSLGAI